MGGYRKILRWKIEPLVLTFLSHLTISQAAIFRYCRWFDKDASKGVSIVDRQLSPEKMDQPGLEPRSHAQALAALRRINFLSGTASQIGRQITKIVPPGTTNSLRILDLACGSGDVLLNILAYCRKKYASVEGIGVDMSPFAIAQAQSLAVQRKITGVEFQVSEVLKNPLPQDCDVIVSSLFLHHLETDKVEQLLKEVAESARHGVVISDLKRSNLGWTLAWVVSRVITLSPIVRYDGPISVQGAFSTAEIREISVKAGMETAEIFDCWPQRWMLRWKKNP
jgi:SAM-dependent methyltransferase